MNPDPTIVFDLQGRSFSLPAEFNLAPFKNSPATYVGLAGCAAKAPSLPATPCPDPEDIEVGEGRHFHQQEEFYHTEWKWGELEFTGQHGLHGLYLCYHAHVSPEGALAEFDPSCEMILLEESEEEEEEFVIELD